MNRSLILMSVLCGLLASSSTGCIRYHDFSNELHVKKLACKSYDNRYDFDPGFKDARHFERGWKEGYTDVALGGDGNPPTFPPVPYRSFKYRNPEGHQIIDLWFEAYREGANAAFTEGVQHFNYLPTSDHQRYQGILSSTTSTVVTPQRMTPTEVAPHEEYFVPPAKGAEPPIKLQDMEQGEELSVPQVMMELRQMPESVGGARLASGQESEEDGVMFLNLNEFE
ncbi:hypothetical protein [Polystyrenella longa]|nr:hypothetical protein [Polystyrenella longa]